MPLNAYSYMLHSSTHPKSNVRAFVCAELLCYNCTNSNTADILNIRQLFYQTQRAHAYPQPPKRRFGQSSYQWRTTTVLSILILVILYCVSHTTIFLLELFNAHHRNAWPLCPPPPIYCSMLCAAWHYPSLPMKSCFFLMIACIRSYL